MDAQDITTPGTTRFALGVKSSPRGRTWYRTDGASTNDRAMMWNLAQEVAAANPSLPVALVDAYTDMPTRPSSLRMAHDAQYDD